MKSSLARDSTDRARYCDRRTWRPVKFAPFTPETKLPEGGDPGFLSKVPGKGAMLVVSGNTDWGRAPNPKQKDVRPVLDSVFRWLCSGVASVMLG